MLATHATGAERFQIAIRHVYEAFAPPPDILVSEWARRNRTLPKGTTARPGPFRPEKFQVEMMDVICDPNVHEIVVKKPTQVGYSDAVLNNVIGYFIDVDPKPIMMVQPTIDNAKDYGKKRITPMIDSTPALKAKIRQATARRSGNTLQLKEFPGGFLKLAGANSGTGLRSDPVPIVLLDEIEGYPSDVDGEGDPVEIAKRRTDQFTDFKIVEGSTPAKPKGFSRIEKRFDESDQRYFHVPCPHCGHVQPLFWRDPETKTYRLVYQVDAGGQVIASSVGYRCAGCEKLISERYKQQMLDAGRWVAKFPGRMVVGFSLNALYSPWRDIWPDLATEWVKAQKDPEKLKAFINLRLGETWEEKGFSLESHDLRQRCESYAGEKEGASVDVPKGVGLLTAGVDVQDDRLVAVVKGWGSEEESWLIAHEEFFGDPGQQDVWDELDNFLRTQWKHESGRTVTIACTLVDSGGHHTDEVYKFVKVRQGRRIFACKGSSEGGKEILQKFTQNNSYRVRLYMVSTDTAKDRIFSRLQTPAPGPKYIHLPSWADEEYLEQLTAEKRVTKYKRGVGMVREYVKTRARNEALDCEVYAMAALYVLPAVVKRLGDLAEQLNEPPDPNEQEQKKQKAQNARNSGSGSGWVNGWRD
jgi:phage terminase large subunit GpA-like protein